MDNIQQLNSADFFTDFVGKFLKSGPSEITSIMRCDIRVDESRLNFAYQAYSQSLSHFELYLQSSNPDAFKRAGAMLDALNKSKCITGYDFESSVEELKAGYTRVNHGDAQYVIQYAEFFENYNNELMAFNLAYNICCMYHDMPRYGFDYLHNICRYLKQNGSLSVDSLFMVMKSLGNI